MAENSISNPRSKPAPVHQFPHLSRKVLSADGDWFPGNEWFGKAIFLVRVWSTYGVPPAEQVGGIHTGHWKSGYGIGRQSAGGVRRTDDGWPDAAWRDGWLTDTDGEETKGKNREETGELQGARNPGESWRGG